MPKAVRWKQGAVYNARELGKDNRLSQDYHWGVENQHTVVMDDGDAEVLQQVYPEQAKEFTFKDLPPEPPAPPEGGPPVPDGDEPAGDTGAGNARGATGRRP